MTGITLGFKAFDAHELLCHFVAHKAGLYRSGKINVELADITFTADGDLPADWFQASCGAALTSALKGLGTRVPFVAVDRPMFWVWSRCKVEKLDELRGARIATFPPLSPPNALTNVVLRKSGLTPDEDVTLLASRDDVGRLGLLRSCSVEAAVISSAVPPGKMAALGFHLVCQLGDHVRIPTTGLATSGEKLADDPNLVESLVDIHRQALQLIHDDPAFTAATLTQWFDVDLDLASRTAKLYASSFTQAGRVSETIAREAVAAVARNLGLADPPAWDEIYLM